MSFLLGRDTVHGAAGKAFITQNGRVIELFGAKKVDAQGEISSNDMKVIGTKKIQNKPGGVKQTGTGTVYYGTSVFAEMLEKYIHTGAMEPFNMQITNEDKATSVGGPDGGPLRLPNNQYRPHRAAGRGDRYADLRFFVYLRGL